MCEDVAGAEVRPPRSDRAGIWPHRGRDHFVACAAPSPGFGCQSEGPVDVPSTACSPRRLAKLGVSSALGRDLSRRYAAVAAGRAASGPGLGKAWPVPSAAALICFLMLASAAHAQVSPCEQAGSDAERQYALPSGLLLAIGRVESGRWDAAYRRTVPWPWAIDADGEPRLTASKEEAVSPDTCPARRRRP